MKRILYAFFLMLMITACQEDRINEQQYIVQVSLGGWHSPDYILFDHFQFALIHGPNIQGSYAKLLFIGSDLVSITSHIHNWVLFLLWFCLCIFLELFLH